MAKRRRGDRDRDRRPPERRGEGGEPAPPGDAAGKDDDAGLDDDEEDGAEVDVSAIFESIEVRPLDGPPSPLGFERYVWGYERDHGRGDPVVAESRLLALLALEEEDPRRAAELARHALERDPDCGDAHTALARHAEGEERLARLEEAVRAAERSLGPDFFEEAGPNPWPLVESHAYFRARRALADALRADGREDEALAHYRGLLDRDRSDELGVRYAAAALLLERHDPAGALEILDLDPDDDEPTAEWARALALFALGDRVGASRTVDLALESNHYVRDTLLSPVPLRPAVDRVAPGSAAEAALVREALGEAWRRHPEALEWLRDGAAATTAAERDAALASYRPPVTALLRRGAPSPDDPWPPEPPAELSAEDVPELVRLATDSALLECQGEARYAPAHAWYALAGLRAAEAAAAPLVSLVRTAWDHPFVLGGLGNVLLLLGAPAADPLAALLADPDAEPDARVLAVRILLEVACEHPAARPRAVAALADALRRHDPSLAELNAYLVLALVRVDPAAARSVRSLVRRMFDEGSIDEEVTGPWKDVRKAMS